MAITRIETITQPEGPSPRLVFVRLYTSDGAVGHGETYYVPGAVEAFVHDFASEVLLGADERRIEGLWSQIYGRTARFGARGAEMRSLSALDVALWDVAGQQAGLPIHQMLGGAIIDKIPVYNTCSGPTYGSGSGMSIRSSYTGDPAEADPRDDLWFAMYDAGTLAQSLLDDGFTAMKIWPFDPIAKRTGGRLITNAELKEGLGPIRQIRETVGDDIAVMVEGHGLWQLAPAIKIARALEEYSPEWLEDLTLAHSVETLQRLREATITPISVSEFLMTRWEYLPVMQHAAADYIMIDPTWAGGITESKKIATMADAFGLPVTAHDCTGPFTMLAGLHLIANAPNGMYQEVVRAFLRYQYSDWVDWLPVVQDGCASLPDRPGIGATLAPDIHKRPGFHVRVSET